MTRLEGRVAIVTGASRGIGKQIAIQLAERGADVVVAARSVEARRRLPGTIGETVDDIESTGRRAVAVQADVSCEDDLLRVVETTADQFGRIDFLVNNAAYTAGRDWGAAIAGLSRESWRLQFATNLDSAFTMIQAVIPHMERQSGGVIVNMTSRAAELSPRSLSGGSSPWADGGAPLAYSASKAALNRLANALAGELRPKNIAIVNVEPGLVRTEMVEAMVERGFDASRAVPMGDPASAVVKLISDADPLRFTGQILDAVEILNQP